MPGTVLLTGFEPFGGDPINPSWEIAHRLDGCLLAGGQRVQALQLPCVFSAAWPMLRQAIEAGPAPSLVMALGLAASRTELCVERVALNWVDARIPDNAGEQPLDQPILPEAPLAWRSRLPVKAMVQAMQAVGAPAAVSYTAGTFVCNQLLFLLSDYLEQHPGLRGGFMHVPPFATEAGAARVGGGVPIGLQVRAVQAALEAALARQQDAALVGGTLD